MSMLHNMLLLTGVCGGCLAAWNVNAVDCVESDCAALGYNMAEDVCEGPLVRCPFDTSKVICKEKKSCDDAVRGDILYSDFTCSSDIVPGKTPIAVVLEPSTRTAIAVNHSRKELILGSCRYAETDTSLYYQTPEAISYMVEKHGCSCPACDYILSYSTEGTEAGDWFPLEGVVKYEEVQDTLRRISGNVISQEEYWGFYCLFNRGNYGKVVCRYRVLGRNGIGNEYLPYNPLPVYPGIHY